MPYVQGSMKELNRRTVFRLVAEQQEITRTEIADRTKSSVPTVLKITNFLQDEHIISLVGSERTARGRHPQIFRFEPDSILGVGIFYDGSHMSAALVNYYGEEKKRIEEDDCETFDYMMEKRFQRVIQELVEDVPKGYVRGVGICISAAVDTEHSRIHTGGFSKLAVERDTVESVRILSGQVGLPVYLFNDVNAAAVGEYVLRKMKNEDLVYVYISNGIGAGIILEGKLRTGQKFYSGEIAHMVFEPDYVIDRSKAGWMERKLAPECIRDSADTREGQIEYAARYISLVIANICSTLDIQNVVLGGETVRKLGKELFRRTEKYLNHLLLFPEINLTRYINENSNLIGAAHLATERQLANILADGD